MKEKLLEMLEMQKALNENILKEHGDEKYTDDNLYHALLDELGELNHELKAEWCWWKNTQKPVDRDKVLEEYVDCIHFGLCRLLRHGGTLPKVAHDVMEDYKFFVSHSILRVHSIMDFIADVIYLYSEDGVKMFRSLLLLGNKLGFDFDTIYEAYIKKNKVNYERLKNGY